jgi:DNA-binding CsgD family transcriptional regulator
VLHGQRSFVLLQLGRIPEATGAAEAAVRWAESERTQALALCRVALLLNYTGRLDEARQLAQRALDVAQATDDRALQVRARLALSDAEPLVGPHERSLSLLTQAWRGAVGLGDSELIGMVGASMSDALQVSGRLQESVVFVREAIDALRGVAEGTHWLEGLLACNAVEALLALGHWNDAAVLLDEVAPRDRYGFTRLGRAQLRVARGELEAAERDLEAVRHLQNRDSASAGLSFDEVLVKLRLWQNRPAEALAEVRDLIDVLEPGPLLERGRLLCVLGLRAAAELAADGRAWGSPARVAEALADGRRLAQVAEEILGHDEVLRRMAAAEVSRLENRPAPHAWALAVEACGSENPDLCAYARWRQAEALLETSGARTEAKSLLRNAADIAHRLGARRLESEIEALAARARIDLSEGTDAAPPAVLPAAPAGLTPREVEVLRLVGRGHTNREIARTLFMSESTASVHVTHILSKLDLSNRVQAATVAVRLGLVHDDPGQTRR